MLAFERLDAWRRCHELALAVYRITTAFPKSERYGLVSQARRAAVSAATNIVEGSAKRGPAEFARFLDISIGSLNEIAYLLRLARDLGFVTGDAYADVEALRGEAGLLTWRLYRAMRAAAAKGRRP